MLANKLYGKIPESIALSSNSYKFSILTEKVINEQIQNLIQQVQKLYV